MDVARERLLSAYSGLKGLKGGKSPCKEQYIFRCNVVLSSPPLLRFSRSRIRRARRQSRYQTTIMGWPGSKYQETNRLISPFEFWTDRILRFRTIVEWSLFLNFFATWCPACQDEAHDVAAFAEANSADMIVVDVYYREDDTTVRAWRKKYAIALPIAMDEHGNFFHNIGSGLFSRRSSFVPTERCRAFDPVQFPPTIWPKNEHRHSSSLFPIARDSTLPRSDGPHRAAAHSSYRRAEDTQVGYVRFEGRLARRLQY